MTSKLCGYVGDRDGVLISYLYGDIDPADRASFAAHLLTCEQCRSELDELRTVRDHLGRWVPPQPQFNARESTIESRESKGESRESKVESRRGWREIPVWAQV